MDNKALKKKFSSKEFLKTSDLHTSTGKVLAFVKANKNIVILVCLILVGLGVGIPGYRLYHTKRVEAFNQQLFVAAKGLKKADNYMQVIKDFSDLQAHQYARLKLVNHYIDNQDNESALKQIDEGLLQTKADIFSTVLVLKKINILKKDKDLNVKILC